MRNRILATAALGVVLSCGIASANNTPQTLPFLQNWSNTGLITTNDDWSGVPGIVGYLGDDASTTGTGRNVCSILADSTFAVDVIANQTNTAITNGGVAEFQITDPTIALQGSGAADWPNIILYLNTTGFVNVTVAGNLRDIDGSTTDDAVQQIGIQYRVGASGTWTCLQRYADVTTGPSLATLVTPFSVVLPAAADNQPQVQIRILTTNAPSNDEWVGIDDLSVTGTQPVPVDRTTWSSIKTREK